MTHDITKLAEFEIPDFQEITETGGRLLLERQLKSNGIWRIHKNDPDKYFPSDFHADRVDSPEKLDIYTGRVYNKLTGQEIYKLPRKAMKYIYSELQRSKEREISSKLLDHKKFDFLT